MHSLLQAFARSGAVTLCCAEGSDLELAGCRRLATFSPGGKLTGPGAATLAAVCSDARVVISFETRLDCEIHCPAILVVGGLAYEWSAPTVQSRAWDRVVVPSRFVQNQLREHGIRSQVIANGYDWMEFRRTPPGSDLGRMRPAEGRLLTSPHRAETEKGHREAILLTRELLRQGVACTLLIPEQHFLDRDPEFYSELKAWSTQILPPDRVVYHPWISAQRMAEYYSLVDLTLALGSVPEGFGAFAVESIGCGTPVLARARGAVTELLPPDHGLYLGDCENMHELATLAASVLESPQELRETTLARGRAYVELHYHVDVMAAAYLSLLESVAG